jgi:hypothetical protein
MDAPFSSLLAVDALFVCATRPPELAPKTIDFTSHEMMVSDDCVTAGFVVAVS